MAHVLLTYHQPRSAHTGTVSNRDNRVNLARLTYGNDLSMNAHSRINTEPFTVGDNDSLQIYTVLVPCQQRKQRISGFEVYGGIFLLRCGKPVTFFQTYRLFTGCAVAIKKAFPSSRKACQVPLIL